MQNEIKRVRKLKGTNKYLWIIRINRVANRTLFAKSQTKALAQALRLVKYDKMKKEKGVML